MKRVILKFFSALFLVGFLHAELIFDLGAQKFYYPSTKLPDSNGDYTINQYVEASYDLNKTIVSTGLTSVNGYYRPMGYRTGYFGVLIKEPKKKTVVNFSMYCYLDADGCSIELTSEDGQALNVNFLYYHDYDNLGMMTADGIVVKGIGNYVESINGTIEIDETKVTIIAKGWAKIVTERSNFKLKKVNITLNTDNSSSINEIDKLTALTISGSDE